ncbi:MAG TPA: aminotransferase class III-fold pyridoxal phosphate-dependent enzyme, partial [Microthrixaceae bacterium]|nr:aminotransferase class III-fold pyridoxal phosphate-dependent enzyme [Microthrixaceae bacterium]
SQGYFFSSAGGSPVSCVVGLTVLDVIERDGLQQNALVVGEHLRSRLTELAARHPLIGAVHGKGLYMGVELVRDPVTLEPAVAETSATTEATSSSTVIAARSAGCAPRPGRSTARTRSPSTASRGARRSQKRAVEPPPWIRT